MRTPTEVLDTTVVERLRRLGGQEFLVEMIDLFLEHEPQRLGSIQSGMRERDATRVLRSAHSLKSTAGNLGGRVVQDLAQEIEMLAADDQLDRAAALAERLAAALGDLRAQLERERSRAS